MALICDWLHFILWLINRGLMAAAARAHSLVRISPEAYVFRVNFSQQLIILFISHIEYGGGSGFFNAAMHIKP